MSENKIDMYEDGIEVDDADIPESAYTQDPDAEVSPDNEPTISMDEINLMMDAVAESVERAKKAKPATRGMPKIFPLLPLHIPKPTSEQVACVGCPSACWQLHHQELVKERNKKTEVEVALRLLSRCSITFRYEFGGKRRGVVTQCNEVMEVEQMKDGGACFGCKNAMWHRILPTEEGSSLRVYCKALHLDAFGGERKGRFELCEFRKGQGDE